MLYGYFLLKGLVGPLNRSIPAVSTAIDHFASDGDIVQSCAFKPRVVLVFAVLASHIAVSVDLLLVFIHHTSVEVVVEFVLLQDADKLFKLKLHAVTVLLGHDVVVELRVARKNVVGSEDSMTLPLTDVDSLHYSAIQLALRLPVSEVELAHANDDQLAEPRPMFDDVLSRVVHTSLKGPVQPSVSLLLKMAEHWDVPVQLLVLLQEVFLFKLFR